MIPSMAMSKYVDVRLVIPMVLSLMIVLAMQEQAVAARVLEESKGSVPYLATPEVRATSIPIKPDRATPGSSCHEKFPPCPPHDPPPAMFD
jgi:hypothetical protein